MPADLENSSDESDLRALLANLNARGYDQGYGDATDRAMQDAAQAVADERQRIKGALERLIAAETPGLFSWTAWRLNALQEALRIVAAGSVPVATPQPDSRLALLGPARIVLDRCAARENPDDPDGTEAGRMAQRIVDAIGHPVTDQAVVTPADRQRSHSCDETCTVDCGHSRVGMCLVYQVTDRFRWCGLPRGHEDDHDFAYPAPGPVATPVEPRQASGGEAVCFCRKPCPNLTCACWCHDPAASPVPAEQPKDLVCRLAVAGRTCRRRKGHPGNCEPAVRRSAPIGQEAEHE